ncbi:MAG: histidine--tRNA ligase [Phycisphaerae bacterium]|nr:histidine--tRNA ligase [Phycisphaerae bacterium]
MKFNAVKGMRDFYPEEMRLRNYILDAWRRVSLRNGFEEYDAPILESLELFTVKSGEEIAEQLFSLTDRGGRNLAIRPEITPSLARMVAAKINALPRPIKWFSLPRLCRAERPQRGRLREFFQWNIDVIGVESVQADAECIFTLVDFLREVGFSPDDVKVRVGSRPVVMSLLKREGVTEEGMDKALLALDKRPKIPAEAFEAMLREIGMADSSISGIGDFLDTPSDEIVPRIAQSGLSGAEKDIEDLRELETVLTAMGVKDYIAFDLHIVRGLAYYTGVVYEAIAEGERALAGGGRYDNLLEIVGGPACGATGFGMGDVVLGLLLTETGKIPAGCLKGTLEYFVIDAEDGTFETVLEIVSKLRGKGASAEYGFKRQGVGRQLKEADRRGAKHAVLVQKGGLAVKTLATGEQTEMSVAAFMKTMES